MLQSSTLKHLSNILMFRQIMNDIYKEILEVCKAMPCAKPCPPTLHLKNKQTSIFSSASIVFDFVILFRNNIVIKISEEQLKLGKDPDI